MTDIDLEDPEMQARLQCALEEALEPLDRAYSRTIQLLLDENAAAGLPEEATLGYREELREAMKDKRRAVVRQVIAKFFGRIVPVGELNGELVLH
jgi:hypothetical protein